MAFFKQEFSALLNQVLEQLRTSLMFLLVPFSLLFVMHVAVWIISERYNIQIDHFFREPAATLGFNPFLGIMSHIGALLWSFTSAICFFAAILHFKKARKRMAFFFLYAATLTFILLVDDFCLLHERIFPRYLQIPEMMFYLFYILVALAFLIFFYKIILNTDYGLYLIACAFLALSILADLVLPQTGIAVLFEDGFKLFGIFAWLAYFSHTAYHKTLTLCENK